MTKSLKKIARAHWWDDPEEEEQRGEVGTQSRPCWRRDYRSAADERTKSLIAEFRREKQSFPDRPDIVRRCLHRFMRQRYSYYPNCPGGDMYDPVRLRAEEQEWLAAHPNAA